MVSRDGGVKSPERATPGANLRTEQVLESATRLFTEKGFEAASVRDLAAELEIRPSSLYHHFPGKQHILFAICMGLQRDFNAELVPVLTSGQPPDEAIRNAIHQHILFNVRRRGEVLVTIRERRSLPAEQLAEINVLRRAYRDLMVGVIGAGCRQQLFSVRDPKLATMALFDMVTGITHWFNPRDEADLDRVASVYAGAAVALLRGWDSA